MGSAILSFRLIPARAGNTHPYLHTLHIQPAHPRSRGEHIFQKSLAAGHGGSSPLARGTRILLPLRENRARLIPARAGNTVLVVVLIIFSPAHPRSRGEHPTISDNSLNAVGSSPLARGTHGLQVFGIHQARLIPARAGNTLGLRRGTSAKSAHPRSRGEHPRKVLLIGVVAGSSPLARGTLLNAAPVNGDPRLIPARAGNTTSYFRCN